MAMSQQFTPTLAESSDEHQVALSPFGHSDRDFAFDPLSTNRRLPDHADLPVLATVVFAGPTPDTIHVMVPDCLFPPVGSEVSESIYDTSSRLNLDRRLISAKIAHNRGSQGRYVLTRSLPLYY